MTALETKSQPQVALEIILKRNRAEADRLLKGAQKLLEENKVVEAQMKEILAVASSSVPPPPAPPSSSAVSVAPAPASMRPDPFGGLLHAADALVRSWKRRKKKNFKQLEADLMAALEKCQ